MDKIDTKILAALQEDANIPISELAERVGLSKTPCWKRVQKLEADGVIRSRVALLDPEKLNVGVTVFATVRTREHTLEWIEAFADAVKQIPRGRGILSDERRHRLHAAHRGARHRRL